MPGLEGVRVNTKIYFASVANKTAEHKPKKVTRLFKHQIA